MRLGQVIERRQARADAAPEDPAGAEADQRLHVLEAGTGGVLPRIEEREEPVAPVGGRPRRDRCEREHDPVRGREQAHPRARDEQDRADDEEKRERRAEVRLD